MSTSRMSTPAAVARTAAEFGDEHGLVVVAPVCAVERGGDRLEHELDIGDAGPREGGAEPLLGVVVVAVGSLRCHVRVRFVVIDAIDPPPP